MKYKRYSKYKDSGVEWIGEIPEGWEVKRFKFVFAEAVWNWYYASRLINENKYNIFSNLSDVTKQKSILKKIDKIFH